MAYERESGGGGFDGRFGRGKRPVTDYGSSMVLWMRNRRDKHLGLPNVERERPSPSYIVDMLPPAASRPSDCIPAKFLHSSLNKVKHPINVVKWTPEGRRLLTASSSGEFTLWNGMGFNFETIMQAHDSAIRAVSYSHDDNWLISGDHDGYVKFWQPNFNNVQVIEAHKDPIRDLAFAPTDVKFATASDDATIKIWDFNTGKEELTITGHNWEVKSVDWNPVKGLIASGSKDHLIKLWDPRNGRCLTTFHNHKNTISKVLFDPKRGDILATCARDQTARIFDLRMMRDVVLLRGHDKDVQTLTFHPNYANLVSTGGSDGTLFHYLLDEQHAPHGVAHTISPYDSADPKTHPTHSIWPRHKVPFAHDWAIWSLDWHPLGHILASGSNDRITRFWTRNRPGDTAYINDRYHIGEAAAEAQGTWDRRGGKKQQQEQEEREYEDEAEGLVDQKMPPKQAQFPGIPGLPGLPSTASDGTSQGGAQPQFPGMGAVPPPPPPGGLPGLGIPNLDPSNPPNLQQLASLLGNLPPGSLPPMPPPIPGMAGVSGFPPPPPLPANFPGGVIPPGLLPPGFKLPPGFPQGVPPPPPPLAGGGLPGLGPNPMWHDGAQESKGGAGGSIRKRAPLPSQEESLAEEKRRGKYRTAR